MSATITPQPIAGTLNVDAGETGVTVNIQVTRPDLTAAAPITFDGSSGAFSGVFTDTVPDQTTGPYQAELTIVATKVYAAEDDKKTYTIVVLKTRNVSWTIGNSG